MRSYHFISVIVALLLSLASLSAQSAFSLKGTVTDEEGMPLYGCIVYLSETKGTVTDSLGQYSLSIPNDKTVEIHYECLGYEGVVLTVSPDSAFPLNSDVVLKAVSLLDDIIICDPSPKPLRRVEPPTLVTSPETDPIKVTKQKYYDQEVTHQWQYRFFVDRINGIYIPKDIGEAIDTLDTILSAEDKQYVTDSLSLEAFVASTHWGLGMWMRNNWGLWGGSRLQRFFRDRQVFHPDDMSCEILKAYYKKKIQGLEYSVADEIEPHNDGNDGIEVARASRMSWITKYFRKDWWLAKKEMGKKRRELKEEGFYKGGTVYFQFPFGCSTAEEQAIWLSADNCESLPKGKITDINYSQREIKVKLMSIISPHGIIVFDGNLTPDIDGSFERDFDQFTVHAPNRFYMQMGEELWFDLNSHCWDSWWQLKQ